MRFLLVILVGCSLIGSSAFAQIDSRGIKMGHFDSRGIMRALANQAAVSDSIDILKRGMRMQIDLLESEWNNMEEGLAADSAKMSKAKYDVLYKDLQDKRQLIDEFIAIREQEIEEVQRKLMGPLMAKYTLVIRQAAEENDVNYVVDSSNNTCVFDLTGLGEDGKEGVDIVDDSIDLQPAILKKL